MKKTLGICGDSFMAGAKHPEVGNNQHFSEILSNKLDWNLVNLAKGGSSNNAIRLQIDEIIKFSPDLVIISSTLPDRLEIPIKDSYDKKNGLVNISYSDSDLATLHNKNFTHENVSLITATFNNITTDYDRLASLLKEYPYYRTIFYDEKIKILRQYFYYCYDMNWKKQLDSWIINDGLQKLKDCSIPFYIIPNQIYEEDIQKHKSNIIDVQSKLNPWSYVSTKIDTPFHTTIESQYELSELWYKQITQDIL